MNYVSDINHKRNKNHLFIIENLENDISNYFPNNVNIEEINVIKERKFWLDIIINDFIVSPKICPNWI